MKMEHDNLRRTEAPSTEKPFDPFRTFFTWRCHQNFDEFGQIKKASDFAEVIVKNMRFTGIREQENEPDPFSAHFTKNHQDQSLQDMFS